MLKLNWVITSFILIVNQAWAAYYNCTFGPDPEGNYASDIVESFTALNCEGFCSCVGLTDNTCHFGPDDQGNFETRVVPSELADSC